MSAHALVVAKAPVAGLAKTRLGAVVGYVAAADLAAAALLDTLDACAAAFGSCHLALTGDLGAASRSDELRSALRSWRVFEQRGSTFGERLAHAHRTLAAEGSVPVVQVGMDTPQLSASVLHEAADLLDTHGGVLGPAPDGGWWLLGLARPAVAAEVLAGVPMSTSRTACETRRALAGWGVRLATTRRLRDVDTVADAEIVAREAPGTRFAEAWARVGFEAAS